MLDTALATQLKSLMTNIKEPIEILTTLGDDAKSREVAELVDEISGMSDLVTVRPNAGEVAARTPSFTIMRTSDQHVQVTFSGIPMGHEFTSLVLALLQVGGHPSKEAAATLEQVANLTGEHHFETWFSQGCTKCPDVVQALNLMAILNPNITHTAVDGGAFPDEAEERGVLAVPMVFRNGEIFGNGKMSLEEIVGKVDSGAGEKESARIDALDPFDVLIVGGGPAGATAAIYTARKALRTAIITERFGGQVNDTMSIENLSSIQHTEGPKLVGDLERHVESHEGVEVLRTQRAAKLHPMNADGLIKVELDSGASVYGRTVILAPGASWRQMNVPGEYDYRNKGVTFCPHCDGPLFKGKDIAVVGGGNSGIEAAIDLAGVVGNVTVVEFMDSLKADEVLQRKLNSLPNVEVVTSAQTTQVRGDGNRVVGLDYTDRTTGESRTLDLDGVFVQIGLIPNTQWLTDSGVELSDRGEIVVDAGGATNLEGVFAAGDATTTPYKQIVVAFGAGATAALSAFDHLIRVSAPAESVSA